MSDHRARARALAARAGDLARRGDRAAESQAREAVSLDDDCGLAHRYLAVALLQRGATAEALAHARRGAALAPDDAEAHEVEGMVCVASGDLGAAWDAFARAAAAAPARAAPWCNAGKVAAAIGEHAAAAAAFAHARAREPGLVAAHDGLAQALTELGRDDEAAAAWREVARLDPTRVDAVHLARALSGEQPGAPPAGYVATVFDAGAATFDAHLARLGYIGPALVTAALPPRVRFARAVDLGCGTGLAGAAIRDRCDHLAGVDLSPAMLARAAARGCYDELVTADVVAYLDRGGPSFELVVAVDVLVYVGELAPWFAALRARLAAGGCAVFTTEAGRDVQLQRTGRWSHSDAYVIATAAAHELAVEWMQPAVLRHEPSGPVSGHAWRLRPVDHAR